MNLKRSLLLIPVIFSLAACTSFWQMGQQGTLRGGMSSSLVDYLYPKGEVPPEQTNGVPHLNLPLRVGIAFVPNNYNGYVQDTSITEAKKSELLEDVKAAFIDREYISRIEIIPDTYLRSSQGMTGMQQVARLYGVDVMALVSYDQVSASEDRQSSLLYWTIVGAYVIKGTTNEVQTFVDTAVFDVNSRELLFRAPGIDAMQVNSTAIESIESLRTSRAGSFTTAVGDMTGNLVTELDTFEQRIESNPELVQVSWTDSRGSGGAGALGFTLVFFGLMVFARARRKRLSAALVIVLGTIY